MLLSGVCLLFIYYLALQRSSLAPLQHPTIQTLIGACICALTLLWQVDAQLPGWPAIHFLGITSLVLLLGLRLGLLTIAVPLLLQLIYTFMLDGSLQVDDDFLWRWTLLALTAMISYGIYLLCDRYLPLHFFTFIFAGCFLNAMLSACFYYGVSFVIWRESSQLSDTDWFLLPLIALPEALLNGMAMTLLVVYRPQWIAGLRMKIFEQ